MRRTRREAWYPEWVADRQTIDVVERTRDDEKPLLYTHDGKPLKSSDDARRVGFRSGGRK